MTAEEEEFKRRLESVAHDVNDCIVHVYQELTLHHVAGSNHDVNDALEAHPAYFSGQLSAHQTAAFAALHRLYEVDPKHETLASLLGCAQRNLGMFSRTSFIARRVAGGMAQKVAESSAGNVFEPDVRGLADVRALIEEGRKLYRAAAADIRHTMFGHTGTQPLEERIKQFEKLMVRDLERMTVIPFVATRALTRLFELGLKPELQMPETNIVHVVKQAEENGPGEWPHFQVAAYTSEFVRRFTRMAQKDEAENG
jgi:hypothetical protein